MVIHRPPKWFLFFPVLLLPAVACTGNGASRGAFDVRDSAGVQVVESFEPAWGPGEAWFVADEPTLSIGVEEGEEPYQLFRIGGAVRLSDGRIVVANSGSSELRFFDADGRFLMAAGGTGEGPGEFGEFSGMRMWQPRSGELVLQDFGNDRVTVYDTSGTYARTVRFEPTADAPQAWLIGVFADGSLLAQAPEGGGRLNGVPGELIQLAYRHLRYDQEGRQPALMLVLPARTRYVNEFGGVRHFPFIPFVPEPVILAFDERLHVIRGSTAEIEQRSLDNEVTRITRWSAPGQHRVADVWEQYKAEELPEDEERRQRYMHFYEQDLQIPEHVPVASELRADADGNLWVRRYQLPWETDVRWDVMERGERWLGTVVTPPRFTVYDIGTDYILGRQYDSLNVERLQLYELVKP